MSQTRSKTPMIVGGGIAAAVIIALVVLPVMPVTAQEAYTVMETKQEVYTAIETKREAYTDVERRQEAYTDVKYTTEPYTEIETRTDFLGGAERVTLEAGASTGWSAYIPAGRSVEVLVDAEETIETYVISDSEYQANGNSYGEPVSSQATVRYGFVAPLGDTYYFLFYNHHDSWFDSMSVALYSASATMTWDEKVTYYRDVQTPITKYRTVEVPVTKYRNVQVPVEKFRDVEVAVVKYRDVTTNQPILSYLFNGNK